MHLLWLLSGVEVIPLPITLYASLKKLEDDSNLTTSELVFGVHRSLVLDRRLDRNLIWFIVLALADTTFGMEVSVCLYRVYRNHAL